MEGKAGLNPYIPLGRLICAIIIQQKIPLGWANIKHSPALSPVTFFDTQITYTAALQEDLC